MLELDELSIYVGLYANMFLFTSEERDNWQGFVIVMKLLELHPSKIDLTKMARSQWGGSKKLNTSMSYNLDLLDGKCYDFRSNLGCVTLVVGSLGTITNQRLVNILGLCQLSLLLVY